MSWEFVQIFILDDPFRNDVIKKVMIGPIIQKVHRID